MTLSDKRDCLERQLQQDKELDDVARKRLQKELADVDLKISAGGESEASLSAQE